MLDYRDLRRIDLNLLVIFEAILKAGSISKAADQLGMSQPTVSNSLARLRGHFNDRLFIRSAKGVKPTSTALALAGPVSEALNLLRRGMQPAGDFNIFEANRTFRLVAHGFVIPSVLPPILQQLNQPGSTCSIEIVKPDFNAPYDRLASGDVDAMIDVYPHETPGLTFEPLAEVRAACILREQHPEIGHSLSREEFCAAGHVVLEQSFQARVQIANSLLAAGLTRREVCVVPSASDMAATVACSDLIATVTERYAQHVAPVYRLRVLPTPFPFPPLKMFLSWRAEKTEDSGLLWLRNMIRSAFDS